MRLQAVESVPAPSRRESRSSQHPVICTISEPRKGVLAINGEELPEGTTYRDAIYTAWFNYDVQERDHLIRFEPSFDLRVKATELGVAYK